MQELAGIKSLGEEKTAGDCPGHTCNDGDSCAEHHDDDCGNYECLNGCCHAMCDNSKTKEDGGKTF